MPLIHASCVLVEAAGVLVLGPSGSGKSALALALLERCDASGQFARLVADDAVEIAAAGGRLVASVPPTIQGLIERRGGGIERIACEPAAVVRLLVEFVRPDRFARYPEPADLCGEIEGICLPRQPVTNVAEGSGLVLAALNMTFDRSAGSVSTRSGTGEACIRGAFR